MERENWENWKRRKEKDDDKRIWKGEKSRKAITLSETTDVKATEEKD